jgi:hypothetical protein
MVLVVLFCENIGQVPGRAWFQPKVLALSVADDPSVVNSYESVLTFRGLVY